jgi:hypothetical protein
MSVCGTLSKCFVLALLLGAALASTAGGQADSGVRVRVTKVNPKQRIIGTLVSLTADSLRIASAKDSQLVAFPTASVVQLERSVGRQAQTGHGAVVGGVALGATGLLLGLLASTESDSWIEIGPEEVAGVTALFGAAGALLGAIIGSMSQTDRWEPMPAGVEVRATESRRHRLKVALKF